MWVLVSSTGKVSGGWIKDLGFNSHLHQKIDWCVSWSDNEELSSGVETIYIYIYILREFWKLVVVFLTSNNTPNLINLSLFLKHKNEIKTVNWQKLKTKNLPIFIKLNHVL